MTVRMLVAGVGNIFLNDDGFGVAVARALAEEDLPDWVEVADYGIRGMHLAYDLTGREQLEATILVDAVARGDEPGTLTVLEVEPDRSPGNENHPIDAHGMQPDVVLDLVGQLGGMPGRVLLVGCEPAGLEPQIGLSTAVAAAVPEAVAAVKELIREHQRKGEKCSVDS